MSMPSRLPSAASNDTFTNDSPHTMIVSRPSRSTKWCSSNGGTRTEPTEAEAERRPREQHEPDQPERNARAPRA